MATADDSLDPLVGHEPQSGDPVALALAEARASATLFGGEASATVARFRVLERLGVGGMGVVYKAYDPQLDRAVALKLVRPRGLGSERALQEAKALARLSHPNVVPVHDVGLFEDRVFIVMELVRGQTLDAWSRAPGRALRELLDAYAQAGEGLAAAHDAGLVHRDFSPRNAVIGEDGRVRVVDFGLAAEADRDGTGVRAMGTPPYAAPEQLQGAPPSPAADQYALSVALREAILRVQAVPRWLEPVLARGTAADPSQRYSSVRALLEALHHDPRRMLRRAAVAAAVVAVAAGAWGLGRSAPRVDACAGGAVAIARAWGGPGRSATLDRLAELSAYGRAVSDRLAAQTAAWQVRWIEAKHSACEAHRGGEVSTRLYDRQAACFERQRAALTALAQLSATSTQAGLASLVSGAASLPDPERCVDAALVELDAGLPPDKTTALDEVTAAIAQARLMNFAGQPGRGEVQARAAVERARALGAPETVAQGLIVLTESLFYSGKEGAEPLLDEAIALSAETGADSLMVEAWAQRVFARMGAGGVLETPVARGRVLMTSIARRPTVSARARTTLEMALSGDAAARGDAAAALEYRRRAVAEAEHLDRSETMLALLARHNLALSSRGDALPLLEALVVDQEALLGPEHPETLATRFAMGALDRDLPRAFSGLSAMVERVEALHPESANLGRQGALALCQVARAIGEVATARAACAAAARFAEVGGRTPVEPALSALLQGELDEAMRLAKAAIADVTPPGPLPVWMREEAAQLEAVIGLALRGKGDLRAARPHLQRAVRLVANAENFPMIERERALAAAELATVLDELHVDPVETASVARIAHDYLTAHGSRRADLPRLAALARP